MNFPFTILVLAVALMTATAQLLLKRGSLLLQPMLAGPDSLFIKLFKTITNPLIAIAVIVLATSMFLWIKILSRVELSRAYPINIALVIIITSAVSILFFRESLTALKAVGIVLVIGGLWAILTG